MKFAYLKSEFLKLQSFLSNPEAHPQNVLQTLKKDFFGSDIKNINKLPPKVLEAYDKYSDAYYKLAQISAKLSIEVKRLGEAQVTDGSEIQLSPEIADFFRLKMQLQRLLVDLQFVRNEEFKTKKGQGLISTDADTQTERIVLTSQDLSDSFLSSLQEETQQILTILSGPFDKEKMSTALININANKLAAEGEDGNHLGTSVQHRKDWNRGLSVVESSSPLPEEFKTGDFVVDDVEQVVQAYLKHHKLGQDSAPNLRALVSILLTQGAGLSGQLYTKFFAGNFHYGSEQDLNHFVFDSAMDQGAVFFDSKTGNLRFEANMERKYKSGPGGSLPPEMVEPAKKSSVFGRMSIEIDMKRDESDKPIFTARTPDFELTIVRDSKFAAAYPIRFNKEDFKDSSQLDEKSIDRLRPCVEDVAKFAGYSSLEESFYRESAFESKETSRFTAKSAAKQAKFTENFINSNSISSKLNPAEIRFLNNLHENFYASGRAPDELSKDILSFAKQQMSKIQDIDKLRYMHLLKMGERLSKDENKAEYRQEAINILTDDYYKEPMLSKSQSDGLKGLYEKLYDGKMMPDGVKNAIKSMIENEFKLISKNYETYSFLDEKKYAYFVNLAPNYSATIPENLKNPKVDHQKMVEYLSNRTDSKQALLLASHLNENIYREIVEPKITPAYVLRKIGEVMGVVKPRPEFTLQEHWELISRHPALLDDPKKNEPYWTKINKATPEQKLKFFSDGLLLKLAGQSENRENRPIYQALDQLIDTGKPKDIEAARTRLPNLFSRYSNYFTPSVFTINYWLKEEKLDYNVKTKLDNALKDLAKKMNNSEFEFTEKEQKAIEAIIKTISENERLRDRYSKSPEFSVFIKPLAASKSSEINESNADMRAIEVTDEIKNIDNKVGKDTGGANKQIDLVAKEISEIKSISSPPESTPSTPSSTSSSPTP